MFSKIPPLLIAGTTLALAGCGFNLQELVPQTFLDSTNGDLPGYIAICNSGPTAQARLASKQKSRIAQIQNNSLEVQAGIPQLANHPMVRAVLQHVQYMSTNSLVTARRILHNGQSDPDDEALLSTVPKPTPVAHSDVAQFSHTVAETVLRNTGGSPDSSGAAAQTFWKKVEAYYINYYRGNFINYFSAAVEKPAVQTTIGDTEISEAAGVFLEFLFDELLSPTVWKDGSLYYPGGGKTEPTYLTVFNQFGPQPKIENLVKPDGACGMTEAKINALTYLAGTFSSAATGEISISVKSFGGLGLGLGIFGKLSIGDNGTLTSLLQLVVGETVKRLTVAVAAPILEAIQIVPNPQSSPAVGVAAVASPKALHGNAGRAQSIQMYTSPFISGSRSPL